MQYNWENPENALEMVKLRILMTAAKEEKWYRGARRWHCYTSRAIRICSIILFTLVHYLNGNVYMLLNHHKINYNS